MISIQVYMPLFFLCKEPAVSAVVRREGSQRSASWYERCKSTRAKISREDHNQYEEKPIYSTAGL